MPDAQGNVKGISTVGLRMWPGHPDHHDELPRVSCKPLRECCCGEGCSRCRRNDDAEAQEDGCSTT
jgi:hypothetical protein